MARVDRDIIFLRPTFPIRYSFALEVGPPTAATVLTLFLMQRSGQIKFRFAASANSLYEYNYWVFIFRFATQNDMNRCLLYFAPIRLRCWLLTLRPINFWYDYLNF